MSAYNLNSRDYTRFFVVIEHLLSTKFQLRYIICFFIVSFFITSTAKVISAVPMKLRFCKSIGKNILYFSLESKRAHS